MAVPPETGARRLEKLRQLGPAFILAAVVLGPGSITLSTIAGSLYGYQLVWVPVLATGFMIAYTWMSARIGLVTRRSLFQVTRDRYGPVVAAIGGLFGFLSILAFQAGNSAAIGFSLDALFGLGVRFWAIASFLPVVILILLPNLYSKLEILVKIIVGIMVLAFLGTVILVGTDWEALLRGLAPGFPDTESVFLGLGMVATTFSIAAASYQSYLMREKKWGPEHLSTNSLDVFLGIAILGLITILVLLTSASVIHGSAQPVFSAQGMALQLEPLAGPAAFYLFIFGFFFAALSSLIVNPLIGATLLMDGLGRETSMDSRPVKIWTMIAMLVGLVVVLLFEGSPVELLRIAQSMAVVAFPLLAYLVWRIAGDREIMGEYANPAWMKVFGFAGYLSILGVVLNYLRQLL